MTATASTQLALFVSDIREHLREEEKLMLRVSGEGSFAEGFQEGLLFWHRFQRLEEDFFYALSVAGRMLQALHMQLPTIGKIEWSGQTKEMLVDYALQELAARDRKLAALQQSLLEMHPVDAEDLFGKEIAADFAQTFQKSLSSLLR